VTSGKRLVYVPSALSVPAIGAALPPQFPCLYGRSVSLCSPWPWSAAGSYALYNCSHAESTVAMKLRAAGAIFLAKAGLSEWANYRGTSVSGWSAVNGQVFVSTRTPPCPTLPQPAPPAPPRLVHPQQALRVLPSLVPYRRGSAAPNCWCHMDSPVCC